MQKRKRNHWVSQSYLRSFAADPDRREKIWRFSKVEGEPELKPIEKVAVKFYLYAPRNESGVRDYSFEEKLSELENWFGHELWSQLCQEMVDLQFQPLRRMVSLLVAVMYLRNPLQYDQWKAMHRQIADFIAASPEIPTSVEYKGRSYKIDPDSWPAYRDASEDDLKRSWLREVGNAACIAALIEKMRWAVVFSEEPLFVTSDNPISVLHPSLRFQGFNNPETSVLFPLSPTRYLHLDNRHSEPDGHYYPLKQPAANVNLLLWRSANEYMFAHRDPDAICAELVAEGERAGYM